MKKEKPCQLLPALHAERKRMYESRLSAAQSIPDRICNSTSRKPIEPSCAYYRNDGHVTIPSRGVRC